MFGIVNQHIGNHVLGIFWCVKFDLGPLLEGQMRIAKLKSAYITRLLLVLEVLVHCLYGGYNLHRFFDALGLVFLIIRHK